MAPQREALPLDADLVTMTIGGNDSGVFVESILRCTSAGLLTLGQGSPCRDTYGTSFEDTVRTTTHPALVRALTAVRDAAPRARVAILGYPWILPATGVTFVDLAGVSEGHHACRPLGVRRLETVPQGTNAVIVHPNALREQEIAAQVQQVLRLR